MPTIEDRVKELEIAKATREVQYGFIIQSLDEINRALNNGIATDVHDLKIWHARHDKDSEDTASNWKKILYPVFSQIIVSALTVGAALWFTANMVR